MRPFRQRAARVALAALVVLLTFFIVVTVLVHTPAFRSQVERWVANEVSRRLGRDCRLDLVGLAPFTLKAQIHQLSIAGADAGDPVFLSLDRLHIDAGWGLLWSRIHLSEIAASGLRVHLEQLPAADLDEGAAAGPPLTFEDLSRLVTIDEASLADGWVSWADETLPVSFRAAGLSLTVTRDPESNSHELRADVASGAIDVAELDGLAFTARGEASVAASGARLSKLELDGTGISLRITGELAELSDLAGSADAQLDLTPGALRLWMPDLGEVRGKASAAANARFSLAGFQLEADVESTGLTWRDWSADDVRLSLRGSDEGWSATLSAMTHGVELDTELEGARPLSLMPFDARVDFRADDVAEALGVALARERSPVTGGAEGWIQARVDALAPSAISGNFFVATPDLKGQVEMGTLSSNMRGSFADGQITIDRLRARGAGLSVDAQGSTGLEERTDLTAQLVVSDFGSAAVFAHSFLAANRSTAALLDRVRDATGGELQASLDLDGPGIRRMSLDALRGRGRVVARGVTLAGPEGLLLDVQAEAALAEGRLSIAPWTIRGTGVEITGTSRVDLNGTLATRLDMVASVAETTRGALQELQAWGLSTPYAERATELSGQLHLSADVAGHWDRLTGRVTLTGERLGVAGVEGQRSLRVDADLQDGRVDFRGELAGERSSTALEADLTYALLADGFIAVDLREEPLGEWAAAAGSILPIQGRVNAQLHYDLADRSARGQLDLHDGSFSGFPFELHHGVLDVSREHFEINNAELRTPGGVVAIDGELGLPSGEPRLRVQATNLDIGQTLLPLGLPIDVHGRLGVDARIGGTPTDPIVSGHLSLIDLSLSNRGLPALAGEVSYADGALGIALAEPGGDSSVTLQAQLEEGTTPWRLELRYPLRVDLNAFESPAGARGAVPQADFEALLLAELEGQAAQPDAVVGSVELRDARLHVEGEVLLIRENPTMELLEGRARLAPFHIVGGGTELVVQGELPFEPDEPVSARVAGTLPLALLSNRIGDLRIEGESELDLRLEGTRSRPQWQGTARLRRARLSDPALPAALESLSATVVLTPARWTLEDSSARFGGGTLLGRGAYIPVGPQAGHLNLAVTADGIRIPLIEGLRSELDANLAVEGQLAETLVLSGDLYFSRASYVQDIDVQRQLRARTRRTATGTEVGGVLDRIRLDLIAEAPGSLSVRNNLASIDTTASLEVGGTAADPLVTGEVRVNEGGRVFFRDNTYFVSRGGLEYVSDPPTNPRIDIAAHTTVSSYDITLILSGRLQDPQSRLSADPPLSQADIVSLLVTGRTRDEFGSGNGGFAEQQAAQYLSGAFTQETEKVLKRSLGLDQVRIDPALVAGETDPTARVTLGKTVTPKTSITYSRSLDGAQDDIYQLHYDPSPRMSIRGMRGEDGEQSVDAVYTRRFFVGPQPATPSDAPAADELSIVSLSIEGAELISDKQLRQAMGLTQGDRFRRAKLLAALDIVRDLYAEQGFPEARVTAQTVPRGDGVAIITMIAEGRRVTFDVRGVKDTRELRKMVLTLWQREAFVDDIADEAAARIRRRLSERGYVDAQVACELVQIGPKKLMLRIAVTKGRRVRVERIVIEGNQAIQEERIREEILTEESGWLASKWLSTQTLIDDREAVRALYRSLGYLDVAIGEFTVGYPRSATRAVIRVEIEEGQAYRVGVVEFSGNQAITDELLRTTAGLTRDAPYLDADLKAARQKLRSTYDRRGYPQATLNVKTTVRPDDARVDVQFEIDEGRPKTIEAIDVVGARLTRLETIRRELELAVGDPLSADLVAASRQNLLRTGLFRGVAVIEEPGQSESQRRLVIRVDERPNVQTEYGLGLSSDDGIRGSASISHRNLTGRRLYGSLGGRASRRDWRVFGLLRKPTLFNEKFQGLASSFFENEERDAFEVRRLGVTLQLDSIADTRRDGSEGAMEDLAGSDGPLRWFVGYGLESAEILRDGVTVDPGGKLPPDLLDPREEDTVRLGNAYTGFVFGSTNDPTWPTQGNVLRSKLALFSPAFLSEAELTRGFAQWSVYRLLGRRFVWSSGVRLGLADTYGDTSLIPLSERFFAGGDNSIRGFKRDAIVAVGFPTEQLAISGISATESLGGNALFVVNQELVAPLWEPLAVVAFYDAGNLYWQVEDFDALDLRHSAGVGFRVKTPAGPLRLEYAWKLDRQLEESRGRLHFSIGLPF